MARWNKETQTWDFDPGEIETQVAEALAMESGDGENEGLHVVYDIEKGAYRVNLSNGVTIGFPRKIIQGLAGRSLAELRDVHILPDGDTIEWGRLDLHHSLSELMAGSFGNAAWNEKLVKKIRRDAARRAGQAKSERKSASSRLNGGLGGRPKKKAAPTLRVDGDG